jgi:hypothetical protein
MCVTLDVLACSQALCCCAVLCWDVLVLPLQARAAKERERAEREKEAERARAQREKEAEERARAQQEARCAHTPGRAALVQLCH